MYEFLDSHSSSYAVEQSLYDFEEIVKKLRAKHILPFDSLKYCFLSPKTIKHQEYGSNKENEWVDATGYPWCGLSITMFMQIINKKFTSKASFQVNQLNKLWNFFKINSTSQSSYSNYNHGPIPPYQPIFTNLQEKERMEDWLTKEHPDLVKHYKILYCLEIIIDEINTLNEKLFDYYLDKPYIEPYIEDKENFNQWIAEWMNATALHSSIHSKYFEEKLASGETFKDKPIKNIPDSILEEAAYEISSTIRRALKSSGLDSATLLAVNSPETANRLSENVFCWIDANSWNSSPHYLLGQPRAVQNADTENPNHITLLTVDDDQRLMDACGGGVVLQYWIKPDDLKQKNFTHVRLSGECT